MSYNHKLTFNWSSSHPRDEYKIQAIKDTFCHALVDLFYIDNGQVDCIRHNTNTTIQVVDSLPADEFGNIPCGFVEFHPKMTVTPYYELVIKIRSGLNLKDTIETIAHEMVHAKQGYTGDLVVGFLGPEDNIHIWKNKAFSTKVISYEDWPWEIEARSYQKQLASRNDVVSFSVIE